MFYRVFLKQITQPIMGATISVIMLILYTSPSMAQRSRAPRNTPARPAISTMQPETGYTLGGGDRIRIDNVKFPQYSGEYLIPTDGSLNLPLIGSVSVGGLTLEQAAQRIQTTYNRVFKRPQIAVRLLEPRPLNIVVAGEVTRPGSFSIPLIDARQPGIRYPTVTQAIQQAEGVTQFANLQQVQVRRLQNGSPRTIAVNLEAFLQRGVSGQDIPLRDGDTVIVPSATNITPTQTRQLATSSVATDINKPRTVTVVGEVSRPGVYVVKGGNAQSERLSEGLPTVTRALELAGGLTTTANITSIQLRRSSRAGVQQTFNIDVQQLLQRGDSTQDLIVQEGDTIFVPTVTNFNQVQANQLATVNFGIDISKPRTVTVLGEVTNPGSYVVIGGDTNTERNLGGLPTLTRAIQLAGGITPSADIRSIQVRRPTRAGIEQVINVNLWQFLQAGDSNQNLILQEGDTIFIPTTTTFHRVEANLLASTNFATKADQPRTVAVVGEVNRPGVYAVIGGSTAEEDRRVGGLPTVTRALQRAGGITSSADIRRIEIRRLTKSGVEQNINVNFWQLLQAGDFTQDTILQDGDTVFVPTAIDLNTAEVTQIAESSLSPATIQVSVVGEVARPGRIEVSPDTTLNQALLTAGGFNRSRAKRSAVELIRLNSNGTVFRHTVSVDFTQGINEQINPLLRNNDIIVVGRSGLARFSDSLENIVGGGGLFSVFRIFEILGF